MQKSVQKRVSNKGHDNLFKKSIMFSGGAQTAHETMSQNENEISSILLQSRTPTPILKQT